MLRLPLLTSDKFEVLVFWLSSPTIYPLFGQPNNVNVGNSDRPPPLCSTPVAIALPNPCIKQHCRRSREYESNQDEGWIS
ncbi:MAG: hypothetical protein AAF609_19035 [Cyanobacteria bacterium P01_C01_bin.120]